MQANHLQALKQKHARLEESIHKEMAHSARDDDSIARLKREKLQLKEEIARLEPE